MRLLNLGVSVTTATVLAMVTAAIPAQAAPNQMYTVLQAAQKCAGNVMKEAAGKPGKTVLSSILYANETYVRWGGIDPGAYEHRHIIGVPYVTATAVDGGKPGSSWDACMMQHHMPVPPSRDVRIPTS